MAYHSDVEKRDLAYACLAGVTWQIRCWILYVLLQGLTGCQPKQGCNNPSVLKAVSLNLITGISVHARLQENSREQTAWTKT